jgi:hypothetical protein
MKLRDVSPRMKTATRQRDRSEISYLKMILEELARGHHLLACFFPGDDDSFALVGLGVRLHEFPLSWEGYEQALSWIKSLGLVWQEDES